MTDEQDKPTTLTVGPITNNRNFRGLSARTPPSKVQDEANVVVKRTKQIDRLLKSEFGSLAPPPPPNLLSPSSTASDAAWRLRCSRIEERRKEYNALSVADLQALIDEADAELRSEALEQAAKMQAWRESQWPAWAMQDLWSEAEFAALCSGLVPNEADSPAGLINQARETVSRGVLAQTLAFVPRTDADNGARLYGTARHYVPAIAAEWAAARFASFPSTLLAAVHARGATPATTATLGLSKYPDELRAAIEAFNAVRDNAQALAGKTPKAALAAWLETNKLDLSSNARERVATVANWQPSGGAPKTPAG